MPAVALLAEGVDRNSFDQYNTLRKPLSPSSRRAWIEIRLCRKEGCREKRRPPRGGRG